MAKLADLFVKLGLNNSSFNKGLKDSEKKTSAFGKGINKIGGLIAGAFAVTQIAAFGKELVLLGGIAEGVRTAFNRIADDDVLRDLQAATKGTVAELELMKRAVSAQNLGLPVENLASLFEFATKRAQETGESVDFLVTSIVTGIGRKSPLILDNLGISAIDLRNKLDGVGIGLASVADVAAAVGEIAAESMAKSGEIIETNAVKIDQLRTSWADFKLEIAEAPEFQKAVSRELDELRDNFEVFFSTSLTGYEKFIAITDVTNRNMTIMANKSRRLKEEQLAAAAAVDKYQKEEDEAQKTRRDVIETQEIQIKTLNELKEETDALKESLGDFGINQDAELQKTLRQIKANETLIKQLTTLRATRGPTPEKISTRGETPQIGLGFVPEEGLASMDSFFARMDEQLERFTADYLADWVVFSEQLDMLIADGIVGLADEFGQAIEAIFSGDFNIGELGARLLISIGKFLGQFGKMLIAYGIAQEAFWASLGLGPIGAAVAIAAGVALVAIGGAIVGTGKRVSKGNLSTGGGTAPQFNVITTGAQDQRLVATVSGNQLAFVLDKYDRDIGNV